MSSPQLASAPDRVRGGSGETTLSWRNSVVWSDAVSYALSSVWKPKPKRCDQKCCRSSGEWVLRRQAGAYRQPAAAPMHSLALEHAPRPQLGRASARATARLVQEPGGLAAELALARREAAALGRPRRPAALRRPAPPLHRRASSQDVGVVECVTQIISDLLFDSSISVSVRPSR